MRNKCADPRLIGRRLVVITSMPGGNELADPAPGDFNAAPLSDRVGRWPGWGGGRAGAVAGLREAGMHCAPELLRDQQHPCARGRVNPLFIESRPRRASGPRALPVSSSCLYRLHLLRRWSLRQPRCGSKGRPSFWRAQGKDEEQPLDNTNPSVTPDLIRGTVWFGRCRRGGGGRFGGIAPVTAIPIPILMRMQRSARRRTSGRRWTCRRFVRWPILLESADSVARYPQTPAEIRTSRQTPAARAPAPCSGPQDQRRRQE